MNSLRLRLNKWFTAHSNREKFFIAFLNLAILYVLFYLLLYQPIQNKKMDLNKDIEELRFKQLNWLSQLKKLDDITRTPLYLKWAAEQKDFMVLKNRLKLSSTNITTEQIVIRQILQKPNMVTLLQIKNLPSTPYDMGSTHTSLHRQPMLIVFYANFVNTHRYLENLETALPNVLWESFHYQVQQYPIAKVEMEFAILHEKR